MALALALLAPAALRASEAGQEDRPAPESAKDIEGPIRRGIGEKAPAKTLFPTLRDALEETPPFLRDTSLVLELRTAYIQFETPKPQGSGLIDPVLWQRDSDAWALGGSLAYRSGRLWDVLSLGATLYTSQRLWADDPFAKTDLLQENEQGYTALGEAFVEAQVDTHTLRLFRQRLDLPFVNASDSRITPNTFEAYLLRGQLTEVPALEGLHYAFAWIDGIKTRTATEFVPMSEAAGAEGTSRGMLASGLAWTAGEDFTIGAINYWIPDTLDTLYAESDGLLELGDDLDFRLQLQGAVQQSVGADLLPGEPFSTWMMGAQLAGSLWGGMLRLAVTRTGDGGAMLSPFGTTPSFTSMMQADFDRAGELALHASFSFVAVKLGLPALSVIVSYGQGLGARDPDADRPLPSQGELDVTFDYKVDHGLLRGFWFRFRWSRLQIDGTRTTTSRRREEARFYVTYQIPVL